MGVSAGEEQVWSSDLFFLDIPHWIWKDLEEFEGNFILFSTVFRGIFYLNGGGGVEVN